MVNQLAQAVQHQNTTAQTGATVTMSTPNPILDEVNAEINDPKYAHRRHGTRMCYREGCRGPLCKRYERVLRRKYRNSGPGYHAAIDQMLEPIQAAHDREFEDRDNK